MLLLAIVLLLGSRFLVPTILEGGGHFRHRAAALLTEDCGRDPQVLPPVMGAVAFVMVEWLGIPYSEVVRAALVPAVLYFVIVLVSVHLQAMKDGIEVLEDKEMPSFVETMKEGWCYVIPVGVLLYFLLVRRYDLEIAGVFSLPVLIGSSFLSPNKDNHLTFPPMWRGW